jgi:hypothetical protein
MSSSYKSRCLPINISLICFFILSHWSIASIASVAVIEAEEFENGLGTWTNAALEDSHDWVHHTGNTDSPNTGPERGANNSMHYLYLESSGGSANTVGDNAILNSATFNEVQTATLTFHYHMYGIHTGTLSVDVFSNGAWVNDVWSLSGEQQLASDEPYIAVDLDLSAYSVSQIRFRAIAAGGYRGDIALDEITIGSSGHVAPTFKQDVITQSNVIQEQPYTNSLENDVIYGNSGSLTYTKVSGPDWLIVNANGSLSGSPSGADVGSNSFVVEVSDGVLADTATLLITVDGISTTLLNDDFENGLGTWENVTAGDSHDWTLQSTSTDSPNTGPASGANNSPYYIYLETSGGSANTAGNTAILQSPIFVATNTAVVSFHYHMYGIHTGTLSVDVFSDGVWVNDVWALTGEQHVNNEAAYTPVELDLRAYSVSQIRFRATAAGGYRGDMALDNIVVSAVGFVAPMFNSDSITKSNGVQDKAYNSSLFNDAIDENGDTLTYSKVSGPNWLVLSEDGSLSGIPTVDDIGRNTFVVNVSDGILSDIATLVIDVDGISVILSATGFETGFGLWSNATIGDTKDWTLHSGTTPSPHTGPSSGVNTSSSYIYLETSSGGANAAGDTAIVQSDVFDESNTIALTFNYHMFGLDTGELSVDVLSSGVWVNDVWSIAGQQQSSSDSDYITAELDLSTYSVSQIRFRATAAGGYRGDMALDDITLHTVGRLAPVFLQNPIYKANTPQDQPFDGSLIGDVFDANGDDLSYSKISGPDWLNVSVIGALSGTPSVNDTGTNSFVIQVSDGLLTNTAILEITVDDNLVPANLFNDDLENGWGNWSNVTEDEGGDSNDWTRASGATPSPKTGPLSGANNSQHYVYLETSGGSANTVGNTAILQSAVFNATKTATLKFHYHLYGVDTGSLSVDVLSNNTWISDVWSISGQQQSGSESTYNSVELDLGAHLISQIRFRATAAGGYRGDMALDSLEIAHRVQPDSDADGVHDLRDQCSATPAGEAVDSNGCAASERDSDGDGLMDASDPYPSDPNNSVNGAWVYCASEWQTCEIPVPALVRYGENGVYVFLQASESIACKNSVFGNPINTVKKCDYLLSTTADFDDDGVVDNIDFLPADPSESIDSDGDGIGDNADIFPADDSNKEAADWIFCANESAVCTVPVPASVRYGANGLFNFKVVEDTINCNNSTFGSPTHIQKQCEYLLSDTADYDGDGVVDSTDVFPADSTEWVDTDGDGFGDNIDPTDNPHTSGSSMHGEHAAALNLVKHEDATHIAINNGSWFDPNTWSIGSVPNDNARVLIESNVAVTYDAVSDKRLFTVRVDGELTFATDKHSQMIVDTLFVDVAGSLTIGTLEQPVQAGVNIDIIIADNGDIDLTWDPGLLSRGLILHGSTQMHGQEKTVHLKVLNDPVKDDQSITLADMPKNWNVGDTLVIAGTHYDNYKWNGTTNAHVDPEDEVVTISSINSNVISFTTPLVFNHETPRADLKTSVANYSRNITIQSESGALSERHHRGHVMFMHNDNVDVRYVEFLSLGRTDKSIPARNAFEFGHDIAADSNVKGRYPMHFHRTGLNDLENPAIALGNAVAFSPGWGYVHHDANVVMHNNAAYHTFGAAFVAETGNEVGLWSNNIAIYSKGISGGTPKTGGDDTKNLDNGKTGNGFYFEGRMVEVRNNIAASTTSGFAYFHRGRREDPEQPLLDGTIKFDASLFDFPEALGLTPSTHVDDAPILHFIGNEAFASTLGFFVEKSNTDQGHDVRSVFSDFTAWTVAFGAHIAYTSHYLMDGFDLIGKESKAFSHVQTGFTLGNNASDVTVTNVKIDGFKVGIDVHDGFGFDHKQPELKQIFIIDPLITNVDLDYKELNESFLVLDSTELVSGRLEINLDREQLFYNPDIDGPAVYVQGIKTDSLGDIPIPAGIDHNYAGVFEVARILEGSGYYSANGKNYFVLEDYYSDRITGEVHKSGEIVEIGPNVKLGNKFFIFADAVYKGEFNLNSTAPVSVNDFGETVLDTAVIINVLQNDSDPEDDVIYVDGITQPTYGKVFDNSDGTITYHPDFDFIGTDTFKYWVTDKFGNFSPATVTVEVKNVPDN